MSGIYNKQFRPDHIVAPAPGSAPGIFMVQLIQLPLGIQSCREADSRRFYKVEKRKPSRANYSLKSMDLNACQLEPSFFMNVWPHFFEELVLDGQAPYALMNHLLFML
jgi:hypothetical protein